MTVTINGMECECKPGEHIFEIAARNGAAIPTLCRHEGLPGQGCCRVCVVEIEADGHRSIVTACNYPVERKCAIFTDSERAAANRRTTLSLLRARAPESGEIAALCKKYNVPENKRFTVNAGNKCIMCGLCVSACRSLGTSAISTVRRGVDKAVTPPYGEPSAVCVGCASCASVCPTGAIAVSQDEDTRVIWKKEFPLARCTRCGTVIGTTS